MQVEGAIDMGGLTRRCDIVVFRDGNPWMIVECKKPDVPLSQRVCDQACRYNTVLRVPFLLLTNGKQYVMVAVDLCNGTLRQLPEIIFFGLKC